MKLWKHIQIFRKGKKAENSFWGWKAQETPLVEGRKRINRDKFCLKM